MSLQIWSRHHNDYSLFALFLSFLIVAAVLTAAGVGLILSGDFIRGITALSFLGYLGYWTYVDREQWPLIRLYVTACSVGAAAGLIGHWI